MYQFTFLCSQSNVQSLKPQCDPKNYVDSIAKKIEEAIKSTDPNINIGVKLTDLTTNNIIYERNANRHYVFASSLKVITGISLRKYFGNDYKFVDKISQNENDYYLSINDPSFCEHDLDQLIKALKTQIYGAPRNIYIVNATFSLPSEQSTKIVGDSNSCDGAQITKVHIDKNCLRFQLISNEYSAWLNNSEAIPYKIIMNVQIVPIEGESDLEISIENDNLLISGTMQQNSTIFAEAVPFDNLNYIRLKLKKLLEKNNVTMSGRILYGSEPVGTKQVVEINKNFYDTISAALKISDNFVMDYVFAEFADSQNVRKWEKAALLIKRYVLDEFGVNLDKSVMVDGSGLSHLNMFTPAQFAELFGQLYKDRNFEMIKLMLVQPGTGSLKHRFHGVKMFAKTGTLQGVSSLVGYVYDKNDSPYSFAIVSNNYLGTKSKYADLEEKIIRILID